MIYTNKGRRKEDAQHLNTGLAFDNEKLRAALADSGAHCIASDKRIVELEFYLGMARDSLLNCRSVLGAKSFDFIIDKIEEVLDDTELTHPAK